MLHCFEVMCMLLQHEISMAMSANYFCLIFNKNTSSLSFFLSLCLSLHLFICLPVCLSVCLSISLLKPEPIGPELPKFEPTGLGPKPSGSGLSLFSKSLSPSPTHPQFSCYLLPFGSFTRKSDFALGQFIIEKKE